MHLKLLSLGILILLIGRTNSQAQDGDSNPEDIDDVRPPVEDEADDQVKKVEATTAKAINNPTTVTNATTAPAPEIVQPELKTESTSSTTTPAPANAQTSPTTSTGTTTTTVATPAPTKTEIEKKEELLTGKEEAPAPQPEVLETTTVAAETKAPIGEVADTNKENVQKEEEKEKEAEDKKIAAPEFEAKQEVEGGKGEEDPDANVDKPSQADPPKDEADGAAKEDRETPAAGAEGGLHEAVEEAKGNPVAGQVVDTAKKQTNEDEETLEPVHQPVRPHRYDKSQIADASRLSSFEADADESTGFMSFFLVASFLVICIYLLQHNKKKILGLMFEGRSGRQSARRGGNVRYRPLSQSDSQYE